MGWLLLLALLSAAVTTVNGQAWYLNRPPVDFWSPDIDVSSQTRLPRVPPSPYGAPALICPQQNGLGYNVLGFPATPYIPTPFTQKYISPAPGVPTTTVCRTGDVDPKHCMVSYEISIDTVQLRPFDATIPSCTAFPPTELLAYNNQIPGPLITAPVGHELLVRFTNKLTPNAVFPAEPPCTNTPGRMGRPFAIHLHGSGSLAPFDGWAEDEICGGESKEYIYPNQRATTAWYHDHALHITLDNAYHGLAGMYVMSDKVKHGGCGAPYNLEDIEERVMMLRDVVLTPTCQLYYDYLGPHNRNLYGDINTVNGVPWPEMPLEPKWYHFRFLNVATSRPFLVKFKNEYGRDVGPEICRVIASDGGYRPNPIAFPPEGLQMGIAERYEVVCNFERYAGRQLYLWNGDNPAMFKEVPYFCHSHLLALINVAAAPSQPHPPQFNDRLLPPNPMHTDKVLTPADLAQAKAMVAAGTPTRQFTFNRGGGLWTINGETWTSNKLAATDVGQNTWELWHINTGGGWFHPVHVHLVDFYILQRGNNLAPTTVDGLFAFERNAPKDMLFLGPGQDIWVIARFGAHRGSYMFHCHNLVHEDHDMMRAYTIVGGTAGGEQPPLPTANPTTALQPTTTVSGIIYNNFGYNDPRLASASARATPTWPAITPAYVQSWLDQNLYRIFYPQSNDIAGLQADSNPWYSPVCQSLPVFP